MIKSQTEGKLYGMDLFSGIGGISRALRKWVRPIIYCENDRYAQSVLLSRMSTGEITAAPIWDDVCTLRGNSIPNIDIIYGGFPCQDISCAGNGIGLEGKRSGLFFEILRLSQEIRPKFIFLENVPIIRTRGLDRIGKELASVGYDCRWGTVSAKEMGAPHRRERWFMLAYSHGPRFQKMGAKQQTQRSEHGRFLMANTTSEGLERNFRETQVNAKSTEPFRERWWEVEPNVGRVVNELPSRVDRIKCLGNAVVPLQAEEAFKRLMGLPWP